MANPSIDEGVGCGVLILCCALALVLVIWAAQGPMMGRHPVAVPISATHSTR